MIENTEQKIYSVSEINQYARNLLEEAFPAIWVEGEISNLARPSSGHIYFSLKDANAQIRCAMFANRQRSINFNLENGLHVMVKAKVSLYETRGEFQMIVEFIEIAGHGKLQQAFEALKNKLAAEGLFAAEHKKALPKLCGIVGVITSPTGAAIRDILIVLKRRFPAISIIVYPTLVQGQQASVQIAEMIKIANRHQACDVLVLARGGGSLEDLWPFNEEIVAKAIFNSAIPIVSAVGHEIDFTIADFVADARAPTPSAAAELISPNQIEWQLALQQSERRLQQLTHKTLENKLHLLENLKKRLRHPRESLLNRMQRLDQIEQTLIRVQSHLLRQKQLRLAALSEKIGALSPLKTLERGYAIVSRPDGKVIQSIQTLNIGDVIQTQFSDGKLTSVVKSVE
jgi:exodeoxyribonuclease VII large subunit